MKRTKTKQHTLDYTIWGGSRKTVQIGLKIDVAVTPAEEPDYTESGYSRGYPGCPARLTIDRIELMELGRFSASRIPAETWTKLVFLILPTLNPYDLLELI